MFWKTSFEGSEYQFGEFIQKKFHDQRQIKIPCSMKGLARGVNMQKKVDILQNLVKLMPKNYCVF